jgi:hypothetical protein
MKVSFKELTVGQFDFSSSFFGILDEHSFVVLPKVFQQIEISKIEANLQKYGIIIVYLSEPMELIF